MLGKIVGVAGRGLIAIGVIVVLFVVYQLWGTGLQEARSQRSLAREFEDLQLSIAESTVGRSETVVEGITVPQLKRGPGHYPETPLPGQRGNVAIAGHRTTYGQPFHNIDKLKNGDEIIFDTVQGNFTYEVVETIGETIDEGLTREPASPAPAIFWEILSAAVWLGAWLGSRWMRGRSHSGNSTPSPRRRVSRALVWAPYAVGAPVFLVILYLFFEGVGRLLPAAY